MLNGLHLTVLIGPGVPVPPPKAVTDALVSAQVNTDKERTGFQLTFAVGKDSLLLNALLPAGYFEPLVTRVILIVTAGGLPQVLSDGVITRHELAPADDPGKSTLTVTGEDLSVLMDVVQMPIGRYAGMPDPVIVGVVLARYAVLGIVPLVVPPIFPSVPLPIEEVPTQRETDRAYVRQLAAGHGYVFYVEPGPAPGANVGYWGPDIRLPLPQSALNVNFDAHANVDSLTASLDGLAKQLVVITVLDPVTGKVPIPVPVPTLNPLRPPLGARVSPPARVVFPPGLAKLKPERAAAAAVGIMFGAADAVAVSGSLDVLRYGRVLRSRQLVGVRGAGVAYDGFYYVQSVTHSLKPGEYKQNFTLSRDGLVSPTPVVVP
ncbi:MAG: hypothetical protein K2X87_26165 [Gemmataceae bacterium]|nr:hypothetical protein [Gemmataceae bacterium]